MKKLFSFLALFLFVLVPFFAHAAPALDSIPDAVKSKYTFSGSISAVVSDGTTLYVGGGFTQLTPTAGEPFSTTRNYLVAIDLTTYTLTSFDPNLNGSVTSLALSSDGSTLYAGGSFSCVGGEFEFACLESEKHNLAAIDTTTGNADAIFFDTDGEVNALALSSDDSLLFAGGTFTSVNTTGAPLTRNNIAAFTTADGIATNFDPNLDTTVRDLQLSLDESTIYAVGDFTTVNGGIPQEYIAEFDSDTGNTTNFNKALDASGQALSLSSDGTTLYVGGNFFQFQTLSGEGVPFNETTQEIVTTYSRVRTVVGDGATIYVSVPDGVGGWYIGGSFTNVGTTTQPRLAHITSLGVLDFAFDPDIDNGNVLALALSPDGGTLYAGGSFNAVDNGTVRDYVAAFDTSDGTVTAFDPSAGGTVNSLALSSDGGTLYMGGEFGTFDGGATFRNYVGAFTTVGAGTVTAFDPDADGFVRTIALSDDDGTLYMGGEFTTFDTAATARNHIGAFTTVGAGTVTAFDPNADGFVYTLALSPDETSIFAGGSFATIGGGSRLDLAKLNTADGSLIVPFDAGVSVGSLEVLSVALSSDETTLYVAGDFEQIGPDLRAYFAEVSVTTGAATNFDPSFNGVARTISVATSTQEVFVGGSFTAFGETSMTHLLAIDLSDNSLITAFAPEPDVAVLTLALSSDDLLLYAGGDFLNVNGATSRDYLAAFDTSDGGATAFDPGGTLHVYGLGLAGDDTELYVGSYDADDTGTSELLIFDAAATTATLTVTKVVVNDDAGTSVAGDFALTLDGVSITSGVATTTDPGTYTVAEAAVEGYTGTFSGDCALDGTITMVAGEVYTCTLTNDDNTVGGGDDDDDNGGSNSGTHRKPIINPPSFQGDSNLIASLQARIQELRAILASLLGSSTTTYTRDLDLNSEGSDVTALQLFLIAQNKGPKAQALAVVGATGFFGPLTQAALAEYQASVGITPASGYFGPITRAYINGL